MIRWLGRLCGWKAKLVALRAARGEGIAGYKIGCIGKAVQSPLGLNSP
jgi:2-keto-4-pentenoate hydratase